MRYLAGLLLIACAPAREPVPAALPPPTPVVVLANDVWQASLADDPLGATFIGDRRYDALLPDLSASAKAAQVARRTDFQTRLAALDLASASPQDRLTARVLDQGLTSDANTDICERRLWDVDQLGGWQSSLAELGTYQIVDSPTAAAAYLQRLAAIPRLFTVHIANLREGLSRGYSAPRVVVERVIVQLEGMLREPADKNPFQAVTTRTTGIDDPKLFAEQVKAIFVSGVQPAWQGYLDFLKTEYLPKARSQVGVSNNPDGTACYSARARASTTTTLAPQEIHDIGKTELARLEAAMLDIAKAQGHKDVASYTAALKASPSQVLPTREALLAHDAELVARATAALPKAFGRLPPIPVAVKPIEAFREEDAPAAYYYPAADDGSRGAFFYVNTSHPEKRYLYNLEALSYHEAVPGHHLQISIAQSLTGLPELRRHSDFTAFVEGWGLYAERLSDELGLYSSPDTRFGMLNYQAWRATRLIVDTGMHALGWSREQARDFMRAHLALPDNEIENEIDRYIIWPGQALAYMIGRMEIERIRHKAEAELGPRFDLKAFHDRLLENGPLPLAVLSEVMDDLVRDREGVADAR